MKAIKHILVILIGLIVFVSGCSQEAEKSKEPADKAKTAETKPAKDEKANEDHEKEEPKEDLVVDPLPTTYSELEALPQGPYHELNYDLTEESKQMILDTFQELPDLSGNPSEKDLDQFYMEALKMVQEDYKGPEEAIKRLKFQAIGDPEMKDSRYQFKENLNVEIILDASGSMAQEVNGKVKMNAAKDAINKFVQQLPKDAKVGIRVYGHKGSNADSDKQLSCSSSEIMYPISNYDSGKLQASLDKVQPTGWTPIGLALNEAKKDLSQFDGEKNTNIVYLVSDGVSTCEDNPVEAAKSLFSSNLKPIINVIGFDIDNEGQKQLKEIAKATEGIYSSVSDETELSDELSQINLLAETWAKWKEQGMQNLSYKKTRNYLDIFVYVTREEVKSQDEKDRINHVAFILWQNEMITAETRVRIEEKNRAYHDWIDSEIKKFKEELHALNEKNYTEAIKSLEDKYQQNSQ
ncbi:VWA domain-containing protein [Bacillus sp. JJ1609]|uniref:vWA domain-containing protein n=1 Tax=Bacillus sp. JJ1609 TaxID=3122977 RepID=UPI003000441B